MHVASQQLDSTLYMVVIEFLSQQLQQLRNTASNIGPCSAVCISGPESERSLGLTGVSKIV